MELSEQGFWIGDEDSSRSEWREKARGAVCDSFSFNLNSSFLISRNDCPIRGGQKEKYAAESGREAGIPGFPGEPVPSGQRPRARTSWTSLLGLSEGMKISS